MSELGERLQALSVAPAPAMAAATPAPGAEPGPSGTLPPPAAAGPPPRELYSQAYADYTRGNYDIALQGFTQYQRHPAAASDLVDNAQYWIGESYYGKKVFPEAIAAWDALFRDYPSSDKLPDAHVKKGMALEKMGRRRDALREFRLVIDRYPNSPAARIARERLNS
jgi:tol-pal system protein YbgF